MSLEAESADMGRLEVSPPGEANYDYALITEYSRLQKNCEHNAYSKKGVVDDYKQMILKQLLDWNDLEKSAARVLERMRGGDLVAKLEYAV